MYLILIIPALIIAAVLITLYLLPGGFIVERRRIIAAPVDVVFQHVRDFRAWPGWSPWLMHEKSTRLVYSDNPAEENGWYTWDGKLVGAGRLEHKRIIENESIDQQIRFTRPMKSVSDVYWRFKPVAEGTEITWGMQGKLPFFMRWMSKMMDMWIGKDYELGLARLDMLCSDAAEQFNIEFNGIVNCDAETCITLNYEGSLDDMPAAMRKGYPQLMEVVQQHGLQMSGAPLAIFHKINPKTSYVKCDMAIPVDEARPLNGFGRFDLPARKYFRTTLHGDYKLLETAWYTVFSHVRMAKLKFIKAYPVLERYPLDPQEHSGIELQTYLDTPVK